MLERLLPIGTSRSLHLVLTALQPQLYTYSKKVVSVHKVRVEVDRQVVEQKYRNIAAWEAQLILISFETRLQKLLPLVPFLH